MGIENQKGQPNFEQSVKEIKQVATLLKENDIQMLYHNHDFEFQKHEDKYLLDWLYDTVTLYLLKPEIDTCWVHYAGQEPCAYLKKYSGEIDIVHLKDFVCEELAQGPAYALIDDSGKESETAKPLDNHFEFRPLGQGLQNFPMILETLKQTGTKYVIVEQDQPSTANPLESAKQSRAYLKMLGL